ncbi:hypothetical protein EDD11_003189 [Mortierella claussenii]|nr:hypothetical protein EDD11_003189 [Mortierella claussenii]
MSQDSASAAGVAGTEGAGISVMDATSTTTSSAAMPATVLSSKIDATLLFPPSVSQISEAQGIMAPSLSTVELPSKTSSSIEKATETDINSLFHESSSSQSPSSALCNMESGTSVREALPKLDSQDRQQWKASKASASSSVTDSTVDAFTCSPSPVPPSSAPLPPRADIWDPYTDVTMEQQHERDDHHDAAQMRPVDTLLACVDCHISQTVVVDDEISMAQMRIVFPKAFALPGSSTSTSSPSSFSMKDSYSRKSPSLPPLNIAAIPVISKTTRIESSSSTGTSASTTTTATATATAIHVCTAAIPSTLCDSNEIVSSVVATTPGATETAAVTTAMPPPHAQSVESSIRESMIMDAGINVRGDANGGHDVQDGQEDTCAAGYDSTYPSSTTASSPTDYFSPYILPPIPSFSEIGLTFDRLRSSNTGNMGYRRQFDMPDSTSVREQDVSSASGDGANSSITPQGYQTPDGLNAHINSHIQCQRVHDNFTRQDVDMEDSVPDYDPAVFDHIQSDENEAYILWSTRPFGDTANSAAGTAAVRSADVAAAGARTGPSSFADLPPPAVSQGSKQAPIGETGEAIMANGQDAEHHLPSAEATAWSSSSSVLAIKRWSAGESFSGKDQGRDSSEHDRAHVPTSSDGGATAPITVIGEDKPNAGASAAIAAGASTPDAIVDHGMTTITATSTMTTSSAPPVSSGFSKPLERLSGSIMRPVSSAMLSSKSNSTNPTTAAQPPAALQSSEERIIMAATVEKLVEKLTSIIGKEDARRVDTLCGKAIGCQRSITDASALPFLDYTFLTDFFLIYRLFISPLALLKLLLARFYWALIEDTPQRQVVRVRTFVTMRHWLLNYFEYDFTGSKILRRTLIQSLKSLALHPIVLGSVRDERIVNGLRELYRLKRKMYCREMSEMALEQPATRQSEEISPRSSQQQRRLANLEWTQSTIATSSKRSSVETSLTKLTRFQSSAPVSGMNQHRIDRVEGSTYAEEYADQELESMSAAGPHAENDMYQEDAHCMIHHDKEAGNSQVGEGISDDESDDTDLDDDVQEEDLNRLSNGGHLPSPAFSVGPKKSKRAQYPKECPDSRHEAGTSGSVRDHHHQYSHLPSPEASDHAPHHQRSHTVPRAHEARAQPRPLSYVEASIESSSCFALSPPDSPRPLEPYINPPPRSSMMTPAERKKTWSQYMSATVEHLSKVKRAFMPKSSQSIQDLRHHSHSTSSSASAYMYLLHNVPSGGGGGSGSKGSEELTGVGCNLPSSSSTSTMKQWSNDNQLLEGRHYHIEPSSGTPRASQPSTTNSEVSSADGRRLCRDESLMSDQGHDHNEWSSDNGEDDDEEMQQDYDRRDRDEIFQSESMNKGRRQMRRVLMRGGNSASASANRRSWHLERSDMRHNGGTDYSILLGSADQHRRRQQSSTPTITHRRSSLPLGELMTSRGTTQQPPQSYPWSNNDHDWKEAGEEVEEVEVETFSNLNLTAPRPSNRALRRMNKKPDNRASWMTLSSNSSSIFGAVLSQGHLPPSQTIRDRNDSGNVDHFVERLYKTYGGKNESTLDSRSHSGGQDFSAHGDGTGRRSMETGNAFEGDTATSGMNSQRRRTVAQHPHRQTVPIMHHHYHHHYLQHFQSDIQLNHEYPPQRRHSAEVHSTRAWTASPKQSHQSLHDRQQKDNMRKSTATNATFSLQYHSRPTTPTTAGENRSPGGSITATSPAPNSTPTSGKLLEGAAYTAALQEAKRQLKLLISHQDLQQSRRNSVQAPIVLPHPVGRPQGQSRPRPLVAVSANSTPQSDQPSIQQTADTISGKGQTRSSSDPHLLSMASATDASVDVDLETPVMVPLASVSKPSSKSSSAATGTTTRGVGVYRVHSPLYLHNNQGAPYYPYHYHSHNSYENSYNQQRSPMNPRFQSIISPTREFSRPSPPVSMVLKYRSELIAQQLCLIEREFLNQVPWYELVNAGWKKKPHEETAATALAEESQDDPSNASRGKEVGTAESTDPEQEQISAASIARRAPGPWPLSRSQTARSHMQRIPQKGSIKDSPNVTQLVERFNLMCHWVSTEILKTTDLDMRVKVVEKFIRIAQTCYNHSNFSSLTQIMLALQVHEVSRLNRTWSRVRSQEMRTMRELEAFTSMLNNWKHLRNAMKDIADEWGGASTTATGGSVSPGAGAFQEGPTPTSAPVSSSSGKQGLGLFSKMTGKDKEKEKSTPASNGGIYSHKISHNHSSSFGKSSGHSMSTIASSTAPLSASLPSGHHPKSTSGQIFPALVSSLTQDRDRHSLLHGPPTEKEHLQQQHLQQQHGGCIPFLGVYLSDLIFNTELPSFVESKVSSPHSSSYISNDLSQSYHLSSPTQNVPSPSATQHTGLDTMYPLTYSTSAPMMVNLHKYRTIATIIKRILAFRAMASRYPFQKEVDVYDQLMAVDAVDSTEMERLSELCEEKMSSSSSALTSPVFAK